MANQVITYQGTAASVRDKIGLFIGALAGHGSEGMGLAQGVKMRVANALLTEVELAFIEKSRGGTGSDGIKWPPLKRSTIAQRRIGAGDLAAIGIKGAGQPKSRVRGLLTKDQDKLWRRVFATTAARLMAKFGMDERSAKIRAAQAAWAAVKAIGAKTKLEVLGGRQVDILRDTGELLASFSPGVDEQPSGAPGQIVRIGPATITVGTNKKAWHHNTRKPWRRAFWPDNELPEAWWNTMKLAAARGISEAVVKLIQVGKGAA